jgi:sigma-B regulation protein RsbU (phosphoserine phosphatase)
VKAAHRSRPLLLYAIWTFTLLAAVAYQIRASEERFPRWFTPQGHAGWPFLATPDGSAPQLRIAALQPNAAAAGLKERDVLLEVNGLPAISTGIYGDILAHSRPGDTLQVRVRSKVGTRTVSIHLGTGWQSEVLAVEFIGGLLVPVFCILLGFWVAGVRPRDRLSWLLLALLLGFTSFFNSFFTFWGPVWRDLGVIYMYSLDYTWGIWLLLFGIYFPEPFPAGTRARVISRWLMWLIVVPLALRTGLMLVLGVGMLENYPTVFPVLHWLVEHTPVFACASYAASIGCMVCLAWKWFTAISTDARRRLSVVLAGALTSFPLFLVLNFLARLRSLDVESAFPPWLYGTAYILYCIFPISIAYAIVVQRAMDVRLIVRQSVQYTLARRGVIVLQITLSAIVFSALATLVARRDLNYAATVLLMGAGAWGIFLLNGLMHRLASFIDRRFFRETYQADQILAELAESVRTIVETKPLLETVTQRISDALHVPVVVVLLNGAGPYQPACVLGLETKSDLAFAENAEVVEQMRRKQQPLPVYFDDPDAWLYGAQITADERKRLAALQAELLLPLTVKEELIGFMTLGPKLSEAPYSRSDLRLLNSVATQTSLALEVSRLTETISAEVAQRERLNRELEIAREVQHNLFPQRLPSVPGLEYGAECRPAREVGGDYYDFLELPGGKLGIAIGDISGKGIGAAMMMANLEACLRGQAPSAQNLPELMRRVNRMVYEASSASRYATFFYAEYNPVTRQMAYVNAGHNPPVVLRLTGAQYTTTRWEAGGPVIGLLPEADCQECLFDLQPDDLIVLFTDGVSESMNAKEEEWGEEHLIACAKTCWAGSAREILDRLMSAATAFAADAPQHDDMTLVVLRVLGPANGR